MSQLLANARARGIETTICCSGGARSTPQSTPTLSSSLLDWTTHTTCPIKSVSLYTRRRSTTLRERAWRPDNHEGKNKTKYQEILGVVNSTDGLYLRSWRPAGRRVGTAAQVMECDRCSHLVSIISNALDFSLFPIVQHNIEQGFRSYLRSHVHFLLRVFSLSDN